jgi:hypothetical protein
MDPETLAKLMFCFENDPEKGGGHVSGAQDAIGICVPGLCRHYYDNRFWPEKIETCADEVVLSWLEDHLVMVPLAPRFKGCSVVAGQDITEAKVRALAGAADRCWTAILSRNLEAFAEAYRDSFNAQVAMFPGMVNPWVEGEDAPRPENSVQSHIDRWSAEEGVLAWKMPGAGGGGYLALVVTDAAAFAATHQEAIRLTIRRPGL